MLLRGMAADEVFITGAGFSRAISDRMPLLRGMSKDVLPVDILSDPALSDLVGNFELILTYLAEDHPWLSVPDNLKNRAQFLEASHALARVILRAQGGVLSKPIPTWLESLVDAWHDKKVTVITFNYDTLVEKAYTQVVQPLSLRQADHSEVYGISVPDIRSRTSSAFGREARETFRYLKLHGSVNWCYSGAPTFYGETIYDLQIQSGWNEWGAEPEDDLERKAPEKVHLVVPPTTTKSALFNNELVRNQWRLARTVVEGADAIYCLGYSLPETDQMVRYLLGTLPAGKLIVPVDTSASVGRRYSRLLKRHRIPGDYVGMKDPIPRFVEDWATGRLKTGTPIRSRGGTPRRSR
jgi:hypothetical protein